MDSSKKYCFVNTHPEINDIYEFNSAMVTLKGSLYSLESRVKHNTINPKDRTVYLKELRELASYLESIAPKYYKSRKSTAKKTNP